MKNLDPALKAIADTAVPGPVSRFSMPPGEVRAAFDARAALRPAPVDDGLSFEDRKIPSTAGEVNVRIYRPVDQEACPTIVFLHGGGYMLGGLGQMDQEARLLAAGVGAVVLSVDYRLAPEHPLPAAHDDAVAVLEWAASHCTELGGAPACLCVAGESSGANIAATAAISMRNKGIRLAAQLLIVPAPDLAAFLNMPDSDRSYPMLAPRDLRAIAATALPSPGLASTFPYSAAHAASHADLPPAVVGLAGHCPTLAIGQRYADTLRHAGNDVRLFRFDDMFHPFFAFTQASSAARDAAQILFAELRSLLHLPPALRA